MREKIIHALSFTAKALSLLVGLKTLPFLAMLPPESKPALLAVFLFALASTLKEGIRLVLDFMDDGKLNNSYKLPLMALLVCLLPCGLLTGCAGWEVKFQDKTGITPGQAVGLVGSVYQDYERAKAANVPPKPVVLTSGKDVVELEPLPVNADEAGAENELGFLDTLRGLWALWRQ